MGGFLGGGWERGRMFVMVSFCLFLGGAIRWGCFYFGCHSLGELEEYFRTFGFFFCVVLGAFCTFYLFGEVVFPKGGGYVLLVPIYLGYSGWGWGVFEAVEFFVFSFLEGIRSFFYRRWKVVHFLFGGFGFFGELWFRGGLDI